MRAFLIRYGSWKQHILFEYYGLGLKTNEAFSVYAGYLDIFQVSGAFCGHVYSIFETCGLTEVFTAVGDTWPPACLWSALQAVNKTSSQQFARPSYSMCKRTGHVFGSEGNTDLLLNIIKEMDVNRFLDMHKYRNAEWMKDGGGVPTTKQVHHWWRTLSLSPVLIQRSNKRTTGPPLSHRSGRALLHVNRIIGGIFIFFSHLNSFVVAFSFLEEGQTV